MILYSTNPDRVEAVRLAWHGLVQDATFVATASLPEAAALGQSEGHAVLVIDSDSPAAWSPLLHHMRRNAPQTPVLVFGQAAAPGVADWQSLWSRLGAYAPT